MRRFLALNDYCIYLLSLFYLLVDSVAGMLISRGIANIGQFYKMLLILLMAVSVLARKRNGALFISFFCMLTCLISLSSLMHFFADSLQTGMTVFKIMSVLIMFIYYETWSGHKKLVRIITVNYAVFLLNMLAGILGFASSMRSFGEESIGTRGFFFAGNEVAYTFVCLSFLMIHFCRTEKNRNLLYILTLFVSVLVATKACMAAAIGIVLADMYVASDRKRRIFILLAFFTAVFLFVFFFKLLSESVPLLKYIVFKFEQQKSGGHPILNALLSGRVERIPATSALYESCFSAETVLFGMGMPKNIPRLEMDFFEVFYYFGIILFLVVFAFYFYVLYVSAVLRNKTVFMFNVLCIITSFLVGHVVYSLMGGIFFAMANGAAARRSTRNETGGKKTRSKKSRFARAVFLFRAEESKCKENRPRP